MGSGVQLAGPAALETRLTLPLPPDVHTIFFIAYLQMVARDFVRLRFASPRELKSRWLLLKMIADQALTVGDPNAPQPLLELARKLKVLKDTKQRLSALQDVLRNRSGDHPEGWRGSRRGATTWTSISKAPHCEV